MYEPIPTWTLGDRLRKIRRDNADGITQKAFAESIGVGGPAYTAWEGDRSFPREPDDLAERIRYVWGVPKWWTLGKEPPHNGPRRLPRQDSSLEPSDNWTDYATQSDYSTAA